MAREGASNLVSRVTKKAESYPEGWFALKQLGDTLWLYPALNPTTDYFVCASSAIAREVFEGALAILAPRLEPWQFALYGGEDTEYRFLVNLEHLNRTEFDTGTHRVGFYPWSEAVVPLTGFVAPNDAEFQKAFSIAGNARIAADKHRAEKKISG